MKKSSNIKKFEKSYDYLVEMEKEFRRYAEDKTRPSYEVTEGDMGTVKIVEVRPISMDKASKSV